MRWRPAGWPPGAGHCWPAWPGRSSTSATGWPGGITSFHGPALIITGAGEPALAGQAGLGDRSCRAVELGYGVAPDRRDRGYATRAALLTAHWLLHEQHASVVELRIDAGNTASQRVALAAGFTPARTVQSRVPATGETYDLRFVLRRR